MKSHTTQPNFADRLKNYSRMVSTKLESKGHSAGIIAGLSAAACGSLSAHQAAEAAITYSGPVNVTASASFTWDFDKATVSIDGLANFGISAAWFPYYSLYGLRAVGFGTTAATADQPVGGGTPGPKGEQIVFDPGPNAVPQPDKIAANAPIDGNSPFFAPGINPGNYQKMLIQGNNYFNSFSFGGLKNNWPNPAYPNSFTATNPNAVGATDSGFLGVRFNTASNTNTTGGGPKHYGWVRIQLTNTAAGGFTPAGQVSTITVLDWAYETTPDTAILAGDGITAGQAGDFDGDLDVDGNDFLEWQRTDGTPGGLSDWENNYPTPAPISAATGVPEPGTAALLSLGLLATGAAGVRRQRNAKQG